MRYRIALCGFSEFEYRAMHFSFQHPAVSSDSRYEVVETLAEADLAVVDADSSVAVRSIVSSGRTAQAVFIGVEAPPGAARHLPRPIDTNRILRALDELTGRSVKRAPPKSRIPAAVWDLPTLDDVVVEPVPECDPEAATEPAALAPDADLAPPAEPAAPRPPTHNEAKAAARAAARRARRASTGEPGDLAPLRDVLVLDADVEANARLCGLLERFGFHAHPVATLEEAFDALTARPLAAMFLDMPLDDDGMDLLQAIRDLPPPAGRRAAVAFIVAAQLDPADRVRAALAGVGEPLIKPLQRGVVARALENNLVTLPADARRI
jgi:CheY-like chemotaxis protein